MDARDGSHAALLVGALGGIYGIGGGSLLAPILLVAGGREVDVVDQQAMQRHALSGPRR